MKTSFARKTFLNGPGTCIQILSLLITVLSGSITKAVDRIDFESVESLVPLGPPGKVWTTSDGIQHIRDFAVSGPVSGDINGTLTVIANINWNLATGEGTAYGTFVLAVEWNGLTGTFVGRSQWKYSGFKVQDGQGVGHGTGDFEGMQLFANFFDESGVTPLIGTILIPHSN
ncbi:MAG TPA: hypothetical protein VM680_04675 [Verrucomicrobiae bacterium]|nr:hypothetical protein [Verrucomicrobiae bacterium]